MSDAPPYTESMPVEDRLRALFSHLGLGRTHVAGGYAADAVTLARGLPEHIASLMLVCPFRLPSEPFQALCDTARIAQSMPREQAREFRDMVKAAVADGTMVWAEPYHCAVGVKE
jgi:hypothetical protein